MPKLPTNLITGFLGVGKTTAILDLLKSRPPGSPWAVLVNEYGEVGIDEALLAGEVDEKVSIREVAGGCLCCTTMPLFEVGLALLLRDVKPERLLIETSGVAHPAQILEKLRRPQTAAKLELRSVIGIVAPHDFAKPAMRESIVFRDQVQMADVLVLNRSDQATSEVVQEFRSWAASLFPPKLGVVVTERGQLDPAWLDYHGVVARPALFPTAHAHNAPIDPPTLPEPKPGHPLAFPSSGDPPACGWIFSPLDIFDEDLLTAALLGLPSIRLKGVFRTTNGWVSMNRVGGQLEVRPSAYRRDSRLEVFFDRPMQQEAITETLQRSLVASTVS